MARRKKANSGKKVGDRRNFLKNAVAAGTAALLAPVAEAAHAMEAAPKKVAPDTPAPARVLTERNPASDLMVDVLKSLDIEYVCSNPSDTCRGLIESIINYGGNKKPEFIVCTHEESAVAMGNGYAKIEGKPLGVLIHGTVGVQHASMAIYNTFGDRAPVYIMAGNVMDANFRRYAGDWNHSSQDMGALVRDYEKWDDTPVSYQHFIESAVRAYKISVTPPMGPVLLAVDRKLQEPALPKDAKFKVLKLPVIKPPQGDSGAVAEVARLLIQADNPVIAVDRTAHSQAGIDLLVELAELLQAPVYDAHGRLNFPTYHPLSQAASGKARIRDADLILGLDLIDFFGLINSTLDQVEWVTRRRITKPGVKLISINSGDLYKKSVCQNFQRFTDVDLDIAADSQATLPSLIEAIKRQLTPSRKAAFQARGAKLAAARRADLERTRVEATYAWNASPISTARLSMEVYGAIKDEDWSFLGDASYHISHWPLRMWPFEKHHQYIGGIGAGGLGYNPSAAVGAALANRKYGRLSVNIQCDGEMLFGPSILWTAAHYRIPLLTVMHNNRAYHEELMQIQMMCNRRQRGVERTPRIAAGIGDPDVNFAKLAESLGVYGEGPITNPQDLGPALRRAVAVVKRGEPALVDVHTQPR